MAKSEAAPKSVDPEQLAETRFVENWSEHPTKIGLYVLNEGKGFTFAQDGQTQIISAGLQRIKELAIALEMFRPA